MNSFEKFNEKNLPNKKRFFISTKKGKIGDYGKILDGHISDENCLTHNKLGINLT